MSSFNSFIFSKKGSALVIALFFSFCMLGFIGSMALRQRATAHNNLNTLLNKQAYFAARSAMQHFLLKAKLFPTELYDSVEIYQGKNPLFNFTEFPSYDENGYEQFEEYHGRPNVYVRRSGEQDSKGNPRYFYVKLPNKDSFVRLASYNNPDYRFLAPNIAKDIQDLKYTEPEPLDKSYCADKYLSYYYRDCTNAVVNDICFQPALKIVRSPQVKRLNDFDIASEDGYPYTLEYSVLEVKVKAIQGMKKYGEEAIEVVVQGTAIDIHNEESTQVHTKTQKITRKGSV